MAGKFSEAIRSKVHQRANGLCEYCHTNERWQYVRFTLDHLTASSDGGGDDFDNLALACFHCNRRKSNKQFVVDEESGQTVMLFNPRLHRWADHFIWSADGLRIIPLTAIGRATEKLLDFNRDRIQLIRAADVLVNRHPPEDDPTQ